MLQDVREEKVFGFCSAECFHSEFSESGTGEVMSTFASTPRNISTLINRWIVSESNFGDRLISSVSFCIQSANFKIEC